jgi:hypothetical protein
MNALLPIMPRGTPAAAWGAPVIIAVTSPFDLPQNEQQKPRAFIFAIIFRCSAWLPGDQITQANSLGYLESFAVRDNFIY